MNAPEDVFRSLRRYLWVMVGGAPWTVRLQRTRVDVDARPVAIVDPGVITTLWARAGTIRQGDVEKGRPFTATFYPEVGDSPASSAQIARALGDLLDAGLTRGLVTDADPPVHIGAPFSVPVYDFAGVAIEGPERAGASEPYMHAEIPPGSLTVRPLQDPQDELRYTVVLSLRLTWWQPGRWTEPAPVAETLGGVFEATRTV